ncbi:MAG: T9SS type A sorting domain-containing protein [Candidatus Sabulitectum sp.]|nr:T9SS type A sorting domain-containing protein [Candidatus Sabulitectum sp.]
MLSLTIVLLCAGFIEIEVHPDLNGLHVISEGVFHQIVLPDSPFLGLEGEPDLPFMPLRFALQSGQTTSNVILRNCRYDTLPGFYDLAPVTPILCTTGTETPFVSPDARIYSSDSFYPENLLEHWQSGVLWGMSLVTAWIRPVQWNPVTGQIRILRMSEVVVECTEDLRKPMIRARTQWSENRALEILETTVLNPCDISSSRAAIVEPGQLQYGQYVIITAPEYLIPMQELADWKTAKGIPAGVFTTDWVQNNYPCLDLQQSVRAFLTDCRDEGVDFVLLTGDNDIFEARFTYPNQSSYTPLPSDLYYADNNDIQPGFDMWDSNGNGLWGEPEDSLDWHPDLWVGRASVNSLEEAEIFVDKVLIYEHVQTVPVLQNSGRRWPEETLFGYTTGFLLEGSAAPGSRYAESISVNVPSFWLEEKCYESWGNNSAEITIAMINNGPHQVFHANHGFATGMYTAYGDIFTVEDIMELQNISNSGNVAIWHSIACELGAFDTLTCCADAWLNAPEGGGFACMNARPVLASYSFPICEQFYNAFLVNNFYELGIAHGMSLDYLCPPTSEMAGCIIQGNNLFGDPELPMWTLPGGSMIVSCPSSIDGSSQIPIQVSTSEGLPIEGARVCLQKGNWQTGEIYEVGYTDIAGQLSLYANPQTLGEINLTVWAHNFDPDSRSITVSSLENITIPRRILMKITPNPSTISVQIQFSLPWPAEVQLSVFDISGRIVSIPASGQYGCGLHAVTIDDLQPGIYFARIESGDFSSTINFVLID